MSRHLHGIDRRGVLLPQVLIGRRQGEGGVQQLRGLILGRVVADGFIGRLCPELHHLQVVVELHHLCVAVQRGLHPGEELCGVADVDLRHGELRHRVVGGQSAGRLGAEEAWRLCTVADVELAASVAGMGEQHAIRLLRIPAVGIHKQLVLSFGQQADRLVLQLLHQVLAES